MDIGSNIVDDTGTDQNEAQQSLRVFCDKGFDGDDERAGLALGRPAGEIRAMRDGTVEIDDDLVMKMRGIADERGIALK